MKSEATTASQAMDRSAWWLGQAEQLKRDLGAFAGVGSILDEAWFERLEGQIRALPSLSKLPDGPFQLLRILTDWLGEGPIVLARLAHSLHALLPLARQQGRTRHLRETLLKVSGSQLNQIRAALFELYVLAVFSEAASKDGYSAQLFPTVGDGGSTVELRVLIAGRWLNVEAKALGYTTHDFLSGDSGLFYHGDATQQRQLMDALLDKIGPGRQLTIAPDSEPTLLCLALGFNAMPIEAIDHLQTCLDRLACDKPSAILLWNGAFSTAPPRLVGNPYTRSPLCHDERHFLGAGPA